MKCSKNHKHYFLRSHWNVILSECVVCAKEEPGFTSFYAIIHLILFPKALESDRYRRHHHHPLYIGKGSILICALFSFCLNTDRKQCIVSN